MAHRYRCQARAAGRILLQTRRRLCRKLDGAIYGCGKSDEQVVIRQDVQIHRPSEMYVRARKEGEHVLDVRVGG